MNIQGVWKTPLYQGKSGDFYSLSYTNMNIQELFPDLVRFAHNPLRNFVATWVIFFDEK